MIRNVRFNPGHYWAPLYNTDGTISNWTTVKTEVRTTTALRGVALKYSWKSIETAFNTYSFTDIFAKISEIEGLVGKVGKVIIQIPLRSYNIADDIVPAYLKDPLYDGGQWQYPSSAGGQNICLWNANVRDRLTAFAAKLGEFLSDEINLEIIGCGETAVGTAPAVLPPGYSLPEYYNGLVRFNRELVEAFPHTIVRQICNFPGSSMQTFMPSLVNERVGICISNTMANEPSYETHQGQLGIYPWMRTIPDKNFLSAEVLRSDLFYSNQTWADPVPSGGIRPTIQQIADFAKTFNVSHIIWTRAIDVSPITGNPFSTDILNYLNSAPQLVPGGGLNTKLPISHVNRVRLKTFSGGLKE